MDNTTKQAPTLDNLRARRAEILALAEQNGAYNVRVFGSVARNETTETSDVDLLVSFRDGTSIFDQVGLWLDLQDLLGCDVDLLTDHPEAGRVTKTVRQKAIPL
ncbi:MAG: nucleotidyltransferase family protein [Anaerolineae bacterium]|nr:nucleotidyltransferase family protein [Anaerolineae bacterium]MDQ7033636.1 nucleotidyltransferase family protein [Anaerolineae bacterium]